MSTATFRVVFDGPALANNAMDVRDLAPALMALAETLEEANRTLNGERAQVKVQVHGTFRTGSFGIDLDVSQAFVAHALDFLANDRRIVASANLIAILGFTGGAVAGLVRLIRWLDNRKVKRIEIKEEDGIATVYVDDAQLEVEAKAVELFRSYKVRQSLERAIKLPLDHEGVETVAFVYEEQITEIIEKRERFLFGTPVNEEAQVNEQEFGATLQLVSVPLREGYKWRVDDGNGPFTAIVLDEGFVQRTQRSEEAFAAGDILVVRMRRRQYLQGADLRTENEILEVIRHESAFRQIPLPITRHEH